MKYALLIIVLVAALTACQEPVRNEKLRELSHLRVELAVADAEAALQRGDGRVLGVLGAACEVPGTRYMCSEAEAKYGLRILEGTSDEPHRGQEEAIDARARRYARVYNETIVSRA
jgi:hypothetical protein